MEKTMVTERLSERLVERISSHNQEPAWLEGMRMDAFRRFLELPMPSRSMEEWRYTDLTLFKTDKLSFQLPAVSSELLSFGPAVLPEGVLFMPLSRAVQEHPALVKKYLERKLVSEDQGKFAALGKALWLDGVFLYVPKGLELMGALHASLKSALPASFFHSLLVLEEGARAPYFESIEGTSHPFSASSGNVEAFLEPQSGLSLYSLQKHGSGNFDFSHRRAELLAGASVNYVSGIFGGRMSRTQLDTFFRGPGSGSKNLGLFFGTGKEHIDFSTNVFHEVPHTTNDILVKGVLSGRASSLFRGLIKIEKAAQQTNSYLSDHTLMLSEHALANSIPSLMIDANDVKASHGATLSQVDEEQLFYLQSRGLSRQLAETVIVQGFFGEVLQAIGDEKIRSIFAHEVEVRLHAGHA